MKPGRFEYFAPTDLDEALSVLDRFGDDAKVLAGGQSLVPMLNMRLAYPAALIDINRLPGVDQIRQADGSWELGALVRHADAEDSAELGRALPVIGQAMRWVGHRAIRNRGTVVGSLAHADPAAEMPAVMSALDAVANVRSTSGSRAIPVSQLFVMPLVSSLEPNELLVEVAIPERPAGEGAAVVEVARRHGDFALAGVVALVALTEAGQIGSARLVSFATGPVPVRLGEAETVLAGAEPGDEVFAEAAAASAADIDPGSDIHASGEYRRSVTEVLVKRALETAVAKVSGNQRGSES